MTVKESAIDSWSLINANYLLRESIAVKQLLTQLHDYDAKNIISNASSLIIQIRENKNTQTLIETFLHKYPLNSDEGLVLMGIAEALLRIPDKQTQDLFLQEKLSITDWEQHLEHSNSFLINLTTHALSFTGQFEQYCQHSALQKQQVFNKLIQRLGTPLIREATKQAMGQLAYQFVIAETIEQALKKRQGEYLYSFDMLGEAALTAEDAERYYQSYKHAISILSGQAVYDLCNNPSISVKLSALCPRYEVSQQQRAVAELSEKLLLLAKLAKNANIILTVDAEESERLNLSLIIFAKVFNNPELDGWQGFGLAVQAYQKRAVSVIKWLVDLAKIKQRQIPLRLVKGAYWDSEIKRAQQQGLRDYPVFTHKAATDVSYLACAKLILVNHSCFYPQFATHNAHTLVAIRQLAIKFEIDYEFQCLHGMGERLYQQVIQQTPCRIYAPVGCYQDLLPYLVRRLLENGANTSFINQIENPEITIDSLVTDPVYKLQKINYSPALMLPPDLYGIERGNSEGLNLNDLQLLTQLQQDLDIKALQKIKAYPLINGKTYSGTQRFIYNPYNHKIVGSVCEANEATILASIDEATKAVDEWRLTKVATRVKCLQITADLLEQHRLQLVSLIIREGGRCIKDALTEIREAVDFCRYYALKASEQFSNPLILTGTTGEENQLYHYGRGVFVCISPWNFPVAIFIGQISAALVSGNCVIAKPSTQTPLSAMFCIQLLHKAGIPEEVLHFLLTSGKQLSEILLKDSRIAGVAFTGSTDTAQFINQQLAKHHKNIVPLIAETGGQNVMIADNSAHAEQLVQDIIESAFNSAGQRCSALRVLFLAEETADKIIHLLIGAIQQLTLGDPAIFSTDIGVMINSQAVEQLTAHVENMRGQATVLYQLPLSENLSQACFFPPTLIELKSLTQLKQENFGAILHIIRYAPQELDKVMTEINNTGYGLTLGIHSRINQTIEQIRKHVKVGNIYVNRNMIAAVVGVQPFGGMGLSGTGFKAGGVDYLKCFTTEQTLTINTAAIGGNVALLIKDLN